MIKKNKLDLCIPGIQKYFNKSPVISFTETKFTELYNSNRFIWNIPQNKSKSQMLKYLVRNKFVSVHRFVYDSRETLVYAWKTNDELSIISALKASSYFAYYTAMHVHKLVQQISDSIYLNFEHTASRVSHNTENELTQDAIDTAFEGGQRQSNLVYSYNDKKIIVTNGKFTDRLGVIKIRTKQKCFSCTDLERTLIDITVRPVYAGGVSEVLSAYKFAKGKVNIEKMSKYLTQLNYVYPYHQAIGFYLEKAGYSRSETERFKEKMDFRFYLTYGMQDTLFSKAWQLYYPTGL